VDVLDLLIRRISTTRIAYIVIVVSFQGIKEKKKTKDMETTFLSFCGRSNCRCLAL